MYAVKGYMALVSCSLLEGLYAVLTRSLCDNPTRTYLAWFYVTRVDVVSPKLPVGKFYVTSVGVVSPKLPGVGFMSPVWMWLA